MQTRSDIKRGNAGMHPLFGKTHNMHLVHLQYAKLPSVDGCNMTIYVRRRYNMIYETLCVASDAYENIGNCDDCYIKKLYDSIYDLGISTRLFGIFGILTP